MKKIRMSKAMAAAGLVLGVGAGGAWATPLGEARSQPVDQPTTAVSDPVQTGPLPAGGLTLDETAAWLQGKGFPSERIAETGGGAHLRVMVDGTKVGVYMFDCSGDRCGSLQFSAGWATHGKFDISQANRWNRDKRWCRGYYDSVNDPWVERDVDLSPGGTYELLADEFEVFHRCMTNFKAMYGL